MKNFRKAVAMIELIFAIVVMGFAMLAIPNITAQSTKGIESAMMQESVSEVSSHINAIMAKAWDEAYNEPLNTDETIILTTTSGNLVNRSGLNTLTQIINGKTLNDGTRTRNITAPQPTSATINGINDMSDFDGTTETISVYENQINDKHNGDYMDTTASLATAVKYSPDAITLAETTTFNFDPTAVVATGTTSNIKRITTTLTSTSIKDKNIQLNSFSCNIGSAESSTRPQL